MPKKMMMGRTELDYRDFSVKYPGIKNPSDINKKEKFDFAMQIGWLRLRNMQAARKRGALYTKLAGKDG